MSLKNIKCSVGPTPCSFALCPNFQLLSPCHDVIKSSPAVIDFSLVPSRLAIDRSLISAKQTLTRIHPTYERPSIVSKSENDIFFFLFFLRKWHFLSVRAFWHWDDHENWSSSCICESSEQLIYGKMGKNLRLLASNSMPFLPDLIIFFTEWTGLFLIPKDIWRKLLPWSNILKEILSFSLEPNSWQHQSDQVVII